MTISQKLKLFIFKTVYHNSVCNYFLTVVLIAIIATVYHDYIST